MNHFKIRLLIMAMVVFVGFATVECSGSNGEGDVPISGNTYYVATKGADANPGSLVRPFLTLTKAVGLVRPGDLILIRTGIYKCSGTITLSQKGSATNTYKIWAYPGEAVVLDCSNASRKGGFLITGEYWHLKGLEIKNTPSYGIRIEGNHNTIEQCVIHDNQDSGLYIGLDKNINNTGIKAGYNLVINCDSYHNCDPGGSTGPGGNADGFSCKLNPGPGNRFEGCRSWENSDDGWDCFMSNYPIEIENCWTWHNGDPLSFGYTGDAWGGNGNGFKMGGDYNHGAHTVRNCVSFDNHFGKSGMHHKGFDQNHNMSGVTIVNCTAWGNGINYSFSETPKDKTTHVFKNNVGFNPVENNISISSDAVQTNNSWNIAGLKVSSSDFVSLDENLAKAPRNPDGSLPQNGFARLTMDSSLIDKGIDVGLPYLGKAPDLGAMEQR